MLLAMLRSVIRRRPFDKLRVTDKEEKPIFLPVRLRGAAARAGSQIINE
jgi:hypothetical protein